MTETRITVGLMTRNRAPLLKLALQSILQQQGVTFDVVVLDNASTDGTADVVRSFNDLRVTYLPNKTDIGIIRNWNRAIDESTRRSPFVCIFHDDDLMLDGFLAESVGALLAHPTAGMSLCLGDYVNADGSFKERQQSGDVKPGLNRGLDILELMIEGRGIVIPPAIVMFRAETLRRAGYADSPHSRATMDMNLYYRVAAIADVVFIPKALVQCRIHESSDSAMITRTVGGTFWYGTMAERVDAVAYLLQSERAAEAGYRRWLAEQLLMAHAHQSVAIHSSLPEMYHTWDVCRAIALDQLERSLPAGEAFIAVDDTQLGLNGSFGGRRVIPFLERDGEYWGPPNDDEQAIENLQRLQKQGTRWLAIAWPSFWWLDQFGRFRQHLERKAARRLATPHLKIYELNG